MQPDANLRSDDGRDARTLPEDALQRVRAGAMHPRHSRRRQAHDCDVLATVITDEQIRDLVRCGVRLKGDYLAMFV